MESKSPSVGPRAAGQHARSQAHWLATRMLALIGLLLLVLLGAGPLLGLRGPTLIGIELAVLGAIVVTNRVYEPRFDRWLRGAQGEENVGAILDGLGVDGWHAIHDVSLGRGNVDHILIGPGGIFAIETKANRGRIRVDRIEARMLKQAYAEKKLIERVTAHEVQPLLVFSEAYLVEKPPVQREGVTVLPARMLAWHISRRRPVMSIEDAAALHQRLAVALEPVLTAS
jgi:Nuclease-related domain